MKSHCDYECNCSSGAQGPCSSDGARRCFMHSNREEESEKGRKRESGRERQAASDVCNSFPFFPHFLHNLLFSLFSPPFFFSFLLLLPTSSFTPLFSSPILFSPPLSSLLSSSLGRISWVSLEGKCNNAPTRWNRARSIISREMDGPCRAGGGHARTQFRFNKLAKQDPQSDLSLTRRQCLLLRC